MSFLKKKGFIFCTGLGLVFSAVLCMLVLLLSAVFMYKQIIGQEAARVVGPVCAGVSVFCATAVISKFRGRQALPMGAAIAAAFVLAALFAALMTGANAYMGQRLLWLTAAAFGGGALGAVIGTGKNMRNKRRHKRNR